MTGFIRKDKVPNLDPKPGHVVLGIPSTGLHSKWLHRCKACIIYS